MKLLFFDLENATGGKSKKICEFGYVLVDDHFSILEKGNMIINPNILRNEWDWYVVRKVLTKKKAEYEASQTFDFYYQKIKELINSADCVIGHSVKGDVIALNEECKRYELSNLNFEFYDECDIFQVFMKSKQKRSVNNILYDLGVQPEGKEHDAESDAYNTMLGIRTMIEKTGKNTKDFFKNNSKAKGENKDSIIYCENQKA